ncbi:elongation factor Ts [Carbonactinospora thermoautotrophica]|uniref:Elongation factor Ts n=1 Tax=Carbonactinospora thermoautotrophica TaxID=1469144 RepID=A0A132MPM4_9ACTN|nr:translation elongation factor Ts [Carbonactinospora thermoautotrophica]KWW99685.1 Elongation factor Ts [Carbonactinospora thermoautotrophica]KWX04537.1 elongation factor Ts [Carbonactinospora thermoautotrophica]KWX07509.1 elongation factor Ts [Carbonactinospora thermoautotrophica]MCX9191310.1 elongation factor Ts [Carbonactinospora thermoautotrophica]
MANFTAADVKKLRELTAAGMLDCKKALEEANGDFEKAVEILRIKGAKDVGKRAARTAAQGLVTAHLDGTTAGVLLELNCETDFVAKNDRFQQLAADVAAFVAKNKPADVPALLSAEYEPGKTVQQLIDEVSAVLGEKLEVRRFAQFEGAYVATYLHKSDPQLPPTVGVLVELDKENPEVAKDVAQQIAAMAPKYLSRDEVPADVIESERRIAEETARSEGKPEQALPKIVEGRVNSFFKDFTLLEQAFVKDNKKTVKTVLDEAGVTVKRFARFKVGTD